MGHIWNLHSMGESLSADQAPDRTRTKTNYPPDLAAVIASFFPPATAPRICDHVRKDWATKHRRTCCCFCMVQQRSSGASRSEPGAILLPMPCKCHILQFDTRHFQVFRLLCTRHQLDNTYVANCTTHGRSLPCIIMTGGTPCK